MFKVPGFAKQRNKGFFILESVVAIMILGLASAGFFGLYTASARYMTMAERHTVAAALAREKMEQVKSGGFWQAADGDEAEVAGFPAYSRMVRVSEPEWAEGLRLWRIEVSVSWEEGGQPAAHTMWSLLAAR